MAAPVLPQEDISPEEQLMTGEPATDMESLLYLEAPELMTAQEFIGPVMMRFVEKLGSAKSTIEEDEEMEKFASSCFNETYNQLVDRMEPVADDSWQQAIPVGNSALLTRAWSQQIDRMVMRTFADLTGIMPEQIRDSRLVTHPLSCGGLGLHRLALEAPLIALAHHLFLRVWRQLEQHQRPTAMPTQALAGAASAPTAVPTLDLTSHPSMQWPSSLRPDGRTRWVRRGSGVQQALSVALWQGRIQRNVALWTRRQQNPRMVLLGVWQEQLVPGGTSQLQGAKTTMLCSVTGTSPAVQGGGNSTGAGQAGSAPMDSTQQTGYSGANSSVGGQEASAPAPANVDKDDSWGGWGAQRYHPTSATWATSRKRGPRAQGDADHDPTAASSHQTPAHLPAHLPKPAPLARERPMETWFCAEGTFRSQPFPSRSQRHTCKQQGPFSSAYGTICIFAYWVSSCSCWLFYRSGAIQWPTWTSQPVSSRPLWSEQPAYCLCGGNAAAPLEATFVISKVRRRVHRS